MYSEGSDIVPQSNETALHYFKKAADMVSLLDSLYWNVCHIPVILRDKFLKELIIINLFHKLLEVLMLIWFIWMNGLGRNLLNKKLYTYVCACVFVCIRDQIIEY